MSRVHYGVDAPGLVRGFLVTGVVCGVLSVTLLYLAVSRMWVLWATRALVVIAAYAIFMCAYMLWGSLISKVRKRDTILDLIPWNGDERVLDVGCGRGLLLIAAARRAGRGEAVGVDLWSQQDQGSNSPAATLNNARLEGIADRVTVLTGDMRKLPFEDQSFHVVTSAWAVHNLPQKEDRDKALAEMVRVLKPSGWVLLDDITNRNEYHQELVRLGMLDVQIVVASKASDWFSGAVSFGSFRPGTVIGRKP